MTLKAEASALPGWQLGVLLGGRSRRMGRDKATLAFGSTTMLERVITRCRPARGEILLSMGTRSANPLGEGRAVPDLVTGAGPLAGIAALREACEATWLAIVPCDMPFLERDDLEALIAAAIKADASVARFALGGKAAPLPVVLGRTTLRPLARALHEGHNKLVGWESPAANVAVDSDDETAEKKLLNINDEEDLRRALALAGHVDDLRGDC